MPENSIEGYLRWITPTVGDPTYSLLKAHLLFEDLLRAYLARVLPHASALEGSRLTFVQLLAVARASSTHLMPDHWIWKAVGDLNKLRNLLSHETQPKDLAKKMDAYTNFVVSNTRTPLPEPEFVGGNSASASTSQYRFSAADMVTISLYYSAAWLLGFNIEAIVAQEMQWTSEMSESVKHRSPAGDAGQPVEP